jgi:hypothetical protein
MRYLVVLSLATHDLHLISIEYRFHQTGLYILYNSSEQSHPSRKGMTGNNRFLLPTGPEIKNDCAAKGQQQFPGLDSTKDVKSYKLFMSRLIFSYFPTF